VGGTRVRVRSGSMPEFRSRGLGATVWAGSWRDLGGGGIGVGFLDATSSLCLRGVRGPVVRMCLLLLFVVVVVVCCCCLLLLLMSQVNAHARQ
jgi:hypothetical protein